MTADTQPGKPRPTHFPDGTTIRTKALAYRMWREAEPLGWDMTLSDLADALGEPVARVRRVAQLSGWLTKFRTTITDPSNYAGLVHGVDEALETMGSR